MLTKEERIDLLREAQKMLYDAAQMVEDAVDDTPLENYAHAYTVPHLHSWIEDPYQSGNIEELIDALENPTGDDDE